MITQPGLLVVFLLPLLVFLVFKKEDRAMDIEYEEQKEVCITNLYLRF
jgi:hypothetical protein